MISTASRPSRKRIANEKPNASAGAANPSSLRDRLTASSPTSISSAISSTSPAGAPPSIALRSSAN